MHDKHLKIIWICYEYIHRIFMGFHFIMLCGQISVHMPKKKPFFEYSSPIFFDLPGKFCNQGVRPVRKFGLHAPFQRIDPHCWRRFGFFCIIVHRVKGIKSFHPTCGVRFDRFGQYSLKGGSHVGFRKSSSPVSASMGRATGSTGSWFRTFCRNESTSQSTVRAFWAAFMQIVCQCLTGVFSLSVGDRSGLMTSRHSGAAPLGWERMGCYRCRIVPFSNKPGVVGARLRESNFFAIFGEIAVFVG